MFQCHNDTLKNQTNFTLDDIRAELVELESGVVGYKIPTFIFLSMVLLLGIPGNTVVCFIYKCKFPPSASRHFIVALAMFDLLNCVIGIPFEIVDVTTDYFLDVPVLCKLVRFSNTFNSFGSIAVLMIISIDRYRKICRPFRKQIRLSDSKKAVYGIVGISGLFSIPALIVYGSKSTVIHGLTTVDCSIDDTVTGPVFSRAYHISLGLLVVATIVVLIVLYSLILLKIIKQKKRRATLKSAARPSGSRDTNLQSEISTSEIKHNKPQSKEKNNKMSTQIYNSQDAPKKTVKSYIRRSRMTFMMLVVTIAFILGYIPHFIIQMIRLFVSQFQENIECNHINIAFYKLFLRSYFLNSAINPIIYSFFNKRFRQACIQIVKRLVCMRTELESINESTETESTDVHI